MFTNKSSSLKFFYYSPVGIKDEEIEIIKGIDWIYTKYLFYGVARQQNFSGDKNLFNLIQSLNEVNQSSTSKFKIN